jgi:hypothetical protein
MTGQLEQIAAILITISGIIASVVAAMKCESDKVKYREGVET